MTLAVTDEGQVFTWGSSKCSAMGLGDDDESLRHQPVANPTKIESIRQYRIVQAVCSSQKHENFSLFLSADGDVLSCGNNRWSQLGVGSHFVDRTTPQLVTHFRQLRTSSNAPAVKCVRLFAGNVHALALDSSGQIWTWGCNALGQCELFRRKDSLFSYEVLCL